MFDVGFWELALIALITLIVVGPEKMPQVARTVGAYIGRFKRFLSDAKSQVQTQLELDELSKLKEGLSVEDEKQTILETIDNLKEIPNVEQSNIEQSRTKQADKNTVLKEASSKDVVDE